MTIPKKLSYFEKLKDPRWQKLRLEAMEKRGWECENCGAKDKTLNVHHRRYIRGRDPWEYSLDQLQVFCEDCHKAHHELEKRLSEILSLPAGCLEKVIGFAAGLADSEMQSDFPPALRPSSYAEMEGCLLAQLTIPSVLVGKYICKDFLANTENCMGHICEFIQWEYVDLMKHYEAPGLGPVVPREEGGNGRSK